MGGVVRDGRGMGGGGVEGRCLMARGGGQPIGSGLVMPSFRYIEIERIQIKQ